MNIIEEIETLKKRIENEIQHHWAQITLLVNAADSLGHKIQLPTIPGVQNFSTTSNAPMAAPGYQKIPAAPFAATNPTASGVTVGVRKQKRTHLRDAKSKTLRALSQGHVTSADIARLVYSEDNPKTRSRANAILYNLEKTGRVSSILLDENKTFGRRKAWTITQKGRELLNSQS